MGRNINRLSARTAATIIDNGRHADGGGLYLSISPNGGGRGVFLFRWHSSQPRIASDPTGLAHRRTPWI
jgi:hypothetical protein